MKILKYSLILIAIVVISDQLISRIFESLYKKVTIGQSGGKINYLLENYNHISILAMGNSRCAHHVIPSKLNKTTYNLSHNGMSLIFHTGLIDQLVNNEKIKIDTILLHLEINEIFSKNNQLEDIQQLKYYYEKNDWIKKEINKLSTFESTKYILSSFKWNGKVTSILANSLKNSTNKPPKDGYVEKNPSERDSTNVIWTYKKRENSTENNIDLSKINSSFHSYISHIKKLCDDNDIQLICFTSPIYKPRKNKNIQISIKNYFNKMGILFYDYSQAYYSEAYLQSIWNWKDVDHLNKNGAKYFSEKIRIDLINTRQNIIKK